MKGAEAELVAKDILESDGWLVDRALTYRMMVRRGGRTVGYVTHRADFFGAFDLHAVHVEHGHRWVQVCTQGGRSEHRRKIERVAPRFPRDDWVELWETRDDGFRVHFLQRDPLAWVVLPDRIPYPKT